MTSPTRVLRTYLVLVFLSTIANAFIWGINTLFLLDARLSIAQAFAANAFYTVGTVLFEVPTGVVADSVGRRFSYLLGTLTLLLATLLYWFLWKQQASFWWWAGASALLGLGFTFFSGATEAWLVDALAFAKFEGTLESAFARGQIVGGAAMLIGTVSGGVVAQFTDLGVPYLIRCAVLALSLLVTLLLMHDQGFTPRRSASVFADMRNLLRESYVHGFQVAPVRYVMLAAPFAMGAGMYGFYALQPYLLELYGSSDSYAIAGAAAAIVALTQMLGGMSVGYVRRLFATRTSLLIAGTVLSSASLLAMGLLPNFWAVLVMVCLWATVFAALGPVRQAYLNGLIGSSHRATVLSSDSLVSSLGGVVLQPSLGKVAGLWGYAISYVVGAGVALFSLPLLLLAKRQHAVSDAIEHG